MEKTASIKLIIGEDLSKIVIEGNGEFIRGEIKKLREKTNLPPVLITDEIKTDKNSFEIQVGDNLIIKKEVNLNQDKNALINTIKAALIKALT